jgi:hypothetical protein
LVSDFHFPWEKNNMKEQHLSALVSSSAMPVILSGFAGMAFAKSEIKGAARRT